MTNIFQNLRSIRSGSAGSQQDPNASTHRTKTRLGRSALVFAITVCGITLGSACAMGGETVLYSFCSQANCADGGYPTAGLILDGSGNLYGGTRGVRPPDAASVVFQLAPNGTETVLHTFLGAPDGYGVQAPLIADSLGNLYGTTEWGGVNAACDANCGTIFKLAPNGSETVLYNFCSQMNCADGDLPSTYLITDSSGNLYGAITRGGINGDAGSIFMLAPNGTESTLYSFCFQAGTVGPDTNCADGRFPTGGVIADSLGNLYGTTQSGGGIVACYHNQGCGTSSSCHQTAQRPCSTPSQAGAPMAPTLCGRSSWTVWAISTVQPIAAARATTARSSKLRRMAPRTCFMLLRAEMMAPTPTLRSSPTARAISMGPPNTAAQQTAALFSNSRRLAPRPCSMLLRAEMMAAIPRAV